MDRLEEMKEGSENFLKELLERRIKNARQIFEREQRAYTFTFGKELENLIYRREEGDENIVISVLCTSMITESNAYQVAWYDCDIYTELYPKCFYYVPEFLFEEIDKDYECIKELLRQNYIRVVDHEIEEIRRIYIYRLYLKSKEFFAELIKGLRERNICVWFGEYMKNAELIGRV